MLVEGIVGASVGLVNEGVGAVAGMMEGTEGDAAEEHPQLLRKLSKSGSD